MGIIDRIVAMIADDLANGVADAMLRKLNKRLKNIEETMGILADKIKSLIAVETAEGAVLVQANADLKVALEAAKVRIAELEALAATVPELQTIIDSLKADLASADEAAATIAGINPTPIADGVVVEVVENPEIPTPAVVVDAPAPTIETIPETVVVEAAIDALDEADFEDEEELTV